MTGRDRIVMTLVLAIAILGAAWVLVVSPERKQASALNKQVEAAQTQLASAEGKLSSAHAAQSQYASAYASVVSLGKAVPASQEVPALIEELQQASNQKQVAFSSITSAITTSSSADSSTSVSASASSAAFKALPFTFVFEGSYFDLEHLFDQLTQFATLTNSGDLQVSGRLLTVQSVKLTPAGSESGKGTSALSGSITATAYVLPASQGLTGASGASASTGSGASPAASTAAPSSPTSPAIVRLNP